MSMMATGEIVPGGSGAMAMTILPPLSDPSPADESNHRIANSLQLVAAMVAIEARDMGDGAARAAMEAIQRRISAIAGVHRQLYRARDEAMIDMAAYLFDLGHMLEQSCGDSVAGRRVIVRCDDGILLPAQDANAIGIIMSELVSNACKYAYAYGTPGNVRVTLSRGKPCGYRLEIEDRGRGMSAFAQPEGTGLGHRLVDMMATRLDARQVWEDARPGTRFVLHIEKG